jgi:hypothetical protein
MFGQHVLIEIVEIAVRVATSPRQHTHSTYGMAIFYIAHAGANRRGAWRTGLARHAQTQTQASAPSGPDPLQLLAADVDQIKGYVVQLKSDLETLNNVAAGREERLRRWLLALLVWNILMTIGLIVLAVVALRH